MATINFTINNPELIATLTAIATEAEIPGTSGAKIKALLRRWIVGRVNAWNKAHAVQVFTTHTEGEVE